MLADHYCEGLVLAELASVASKVGSLRRKEVFYRYLALQKFEQASHSEAVLALFRKLEAQTRCGFSSLTKSFVKNRSVQAQIKILHQPDGSIEEFADFLRRTFHHKTRQIDQFPFSQEQTLVSICSPAAKMHKVHLTICIKVLDYLLKES